ncbi:MAG TPA: hypothetical protein VFS40_04835 [Gemmatimonadales bacterium]|nr:hypothetical protein [Gemmatimonadales bacterium]
MPDGADAPALGQALAEGLAESLARAAYRAGAGLVEVDETPAVLADYTHVFDASARAAALDAWRRLAEHPARGGAGEAATGDPHAAARARLWLEWIVDLAGRHAGAPLEAEQRAWERAATIPLADGTEIPLGRALHELARSRDRDVRRALADVVFRRASAALAPLRTGRLEREWAILEPLRLGDPADARARLAGFDSAALAQEAERLLRDTAVLYAESLAWLAARRLRARPDELARADLSVLFETFDAPVPTDGDRLVTLARDQFAALGLDVAASGRVHFDAEARAGKRMRAFCAPVRVPDEVWVVLRSEGTVTDLQSCWHELGHALHLTAVAPELPFDQRRLVDRATAEGIAILFGRIPGEQVWIRRFLGASRADAEALGRERAVFELFLLRRYAAKLLVELDAYAAASVADLPGRYAERLTEATLVRYRPEEALLDLDPGLAAAAYVRGAMLAAALDAAFVERYDVDWFRNPAAGGPLGALLAADRATAPEALAAAWADGAPADAAAVVRLAERVLG